MMQKLPTGNFKWLNREEINMFIKQFLSNQIDLNGDTGLIL